MKKFLYLLYIGMLLSLLSACHRHPYYDLERVEAGSLHILFDWNGYTDIPPGMNLMFYPIKDDRSQPTDYAGAPILHQLQYDGGTVSLPVGRYNVAIYNDYTYQIMYRGMGDFHTAEAWLEDYDRLPLSAQSKSARNVAEPDIYYVTQQTDPLWCTVKDAHVNDRNGTAINGQTSDEYEPVSGAIPLKFRHLLSKVVVNVKLAEAYEGTTATLKSLVLKDVCKHAIFSPSGGLTSGTWTLQTGTSYWTSYTIHASTAAALTLSNSSQKLGQLFMIPQDVYVNSYSTNRYNTCFEITYEHTLAGGGTREITKAISLPNSWEMDKVYNYTISLSLDVNDINITADVLNRSEEVNNSANNTPAQAVDLGLPSGTKWASHDYGIESESDLSPIFKSYYGGDIVKNWGSNWTVPTLAQWEELKNNCTRTEEAINGIEGYKFTASNGNSIFFSKKNGELYMYYDGYSDGYSILEDYTQDGCFPIRPVTQ